MADKTKSRVSYAKELRSEASLAMRGLATISITFLDGTRLEHQQAVDLDEAQFVKWCAVLLARPDVREYPKLEELVRRICEERGITE
jgi:hypothetical protein